MLLSFDDCLANAVMGEEVRCIKSIFVIVKGEMGVHVIFYFQIKILFMLLCFVLMFIMLFPEILYPYYITGM